ncbi:hypothetical protein HK104_003660 [Borealophlyctis nickersoniae]|nr:hypothetical protein HK104_003660 [Borealophlyctis nickersoniae]
MSSTSEEATASSIPSTPTSAIVQIPRRQSRNYVVVSTPEEYDADPFGGRTSDLSPPHNRLSTLSWLTSWSTFLAAKPGGKTASGHSHERIQDEEPVPVVEEEAEGEAGEALNRPTQGSQLGAGNGDGYDPTLFTRLHGIEAEETRRRGRSGTDRNNSGRRNYEGDPEHQPLLPKPLDESPVPRSTSLHATLNLLNTMMGMGILSLPYALSISGWTMGLTMLFAFVLLASHTAKLLTRCMESREINLPSTIHFNAPPITKPTTYGDVGERAFGPRGRQFITTLFSLELFTASTALIILASDSFHTLFPSFDSLKIKCAVAAFVCFTTWPRSLRLLSYASAIGIVTVVTLLVVLIYDGTSTREPPGSLLTPAETSWSPQSIHAVALSIGLIFVGLDAHALVPTVYRDTKTPHHFPRTINITYSIIFLVYVTFGACGYLMFGPDTKPEITVNLANVESYNRVLTRIGVWLVAVNPLTKFALIMTPVNANFVPKSASNPNLSLSIKESLFSMHTPPLRLLSRTLTTLLVLFIAILFPSFHRTMAIIGSAFSFTIAVAFPTLCYLRLFKDSLTAWERVGGWMIVVGGVVCAVVGTVGAVVPVVK